MMEVLEGAPDADQSRWSQTRLYLNQLQPSDCGPWFSREHAFVVTPG